MFASGLLYFDSQGLCGDSTLGNHGLQGKPQSDSCAVLLPFCALIIERCLPDTSGAVPALNSKVYLLVELWTPCIHLLELEGTLVSYRDMFMIERKAPPYPHSQK